MNTEERLAKAEELLQKVLNCVDEPALKYLAPSEIKKVNEIKEFLNPKPEIDWSQVPVGTRISHNVQGLDYFLKYSRGSISTLFKHIVEKDSCTIPPQPSYIHKCPWPEDGVKPVWVKDDNMICRIYNNGSFSSPHKAVTVEWDVHGKWFAVLKVAEYWK